MVSFNFYLCIFICSQMFPQVATVSYPTPRALNPTAFQTAATVAAVPPVPPATPNPSPKQRVFTGTVTKVHDNFGFVDEDVFFQTRWGAVIGCVNCILLIPHKNVFPILHVDETSFENCTLWNVPVIKVIGCDLYDCNLHPSRGIGSFPQFALHLWRSTSWKEIHAVDII